MASSSTGRIRDPQRRERILTAAATLISTKGYATVNLKEIGAAAGIVGSGIYRHFDSKAAILVALFDEVVDHLVAGAEEAVTQASDLQATLTTLIDGHVRFVLDSRVLCQVYVREADSLPDSDQLRLRWKQRHYVSLWEAALNGLRPDLTEENVKVLVRAAIAVIHSVLTSPPSMEDSALATLLAEAARRVLGISS